MSRIAVMGSGSWGTAFALILCDAGNDVTMWARREEVAEAITTWSPSRTLPSASCTRTPDEDVVTWVIGIASVMREGPTPSASFSASC